MTSSTQSGSTAVLWVSWAFAALVSSGYAVLGLATFNSLHRVYKSLPIAQEQHELHGTEIAAVAGPVLVTLLNLTSLIILFYKTLRHSGTGFAYGFINSAYLHQGLFLIVTSYLLQSDRDVLSELEKVGKLERLWGNLDSKLYELAIYTGYVAAGFFIAEFVFLIIFAEAVKHFETKKPHPRDELNDQLLPPGTPVHD